MKINGSFKINMCKDKNVILYKDYVYFLYNIITCIYLVIYFYFINNVLKTWFIEQKYWAKDIIFLITEHEQLGIQAWLDAYHGVTSGNEGILVSGDLPGRAGSIQTAINLELHSMKITSIDVKVCLFY